MRGRAVSNPACRNAAGQSWRRSGCHRATVGCRGTEIVSVADLNSMTTGGRFETVVPRPRTVGALSSPEPGSRLARRRRKRGEETSSIGCAHRHHVGHLLHARNGTVVDVSWLQLSTATRAKSMPPPYQRLPNGSLTSGSGCG